MTSQPFHIAIWLIKTVNFDSSIAPYQIFLISNITKNCKYFVRHLIIMFHFYFNSAHISLSFYFVPLLFWFHSMFGYFFFFCIWNRKIKFIITDSNYHIRSDAFCTTLFFLPSSGFEWKTIKANFFIKLPLIHSWYWVICVREGKYFRGLSALHLLILDTLYLSLCPFVQ